MAVQAAQEQPSKANEQSASTTKYKNIFLFSSAQYMLAQTGFSAISTNHTKFSTDDSNLFATGQIQNVEKTIIFLIV